MRRAHGPRRRGARWTLGMAAVAALALARPALAETAWVKDELTLNLRTGPGSRYRIVSSLKTGDSVEVLERREEWTQVRVNEEEGWIPVGYLQAEMPAGMKVSRWETEIGQLRSQVGALETETERLRSANVALTGQVSGQREELDRLGRENLELRAGSRWPEMAAGAGILAAGMILGAGLQRRGRRGGAKIRI